MQQSDLVFSNKQKTTGNNLIEVRHKHAILEPNPHILRDLDKNIDLARIDDHGIWIYEDGRCVSQFKISSLGATPHSPNEARLVYFFLDGNNNEIAKWDAGTCPCNCGDTNALRERTGQIDGSLYDKIMHVEVPVNGDWVKC
ncbi:hypothetical protein BK121_08785 [Paenibacillus odorifer]|uniref:hypothetical protein n=1 Tax=Paenibacillus odorifer TaxID=189426 RepID=UPI00096E4BB1|nr:hypothetical protein [Paenibacillus odorifer]OMC72996.1 hypothetical protein BK121_08785 [Paenibacillus odorifer]